MLVLVSVLKIKRGEEKGKSLEWSGVVRLIYWGKRRLVEGFSFVCLLLCDKEGWLHVYILITLRTRSIWQKEVAYT